ncbi:MAG TPA: SrtB family sortase, partial [Candidatus Mediterraneibacter cottocaccae]|nr:SrtB family sortase [Candidatus Mediterraneibacter cottocaccae]
MKDNKKKKTKKKGDLLLTIALIIAVIVFCFAAYNLYHIYTEYKKGTDEYNHIEQMAVTERAPETEDTEQ